eukprot:4847225-Prorocentrum_lima.AAC.1
MAKDAFNVGTVEDIDREWGPRQSQGRSQHQVHRHNFERAMRQRSDRPCVGVSPARETGDVCQHL